MKIKYFYSSQSVLGTITKQGVLLFSILGLFSFEPPIIIFSLLLIAGLYFHGWYPELKKEIDLHEEETKKLLKEEGFAQLTPLIKDSKTAIYIDQEKRKILFNIGFSEKRLLYGFDDILSWQWQWIEKDAKKYENKIVFQLRDLENPIIKINIRNSSEAEEWNVKIGLILG